MLPKGTYFISGIDTDAGKSFATGFIARELSLSGFTVMTQKFIQTGGVGERGVSIDIDIHRQIMGIDLRDEDLSGESCPVIFSYPASPHLSKEIDNREIDFDAIKRSTASLSSKYDVLLIEGAGGLFVPLSSDYFTIDYIKESGLPLILVTSGKLGSINHTILSLESCASRNIPIAAIAYNHFFDDDEIISRDTHKFMQNYLKKHHPDTLFIDVPKL